MASFRGKWKKEKKAEVNAITLYWISVAIKTSRGSQNKLKTHYMALVSR
jgi:hypothetical protein